MPEAVVIIICLVLILRSMIGARRTGPSSLGSASAASTGKILVIGSVTVVALAQLGAAPWALSSTGVAVGVLAALAVSFGPLHPIAAWGLTALGAAASIPAMTSIVAAPACTVAPTPVVGRVAALLLLVVFGITGMGWAFTSLGRIEPIVGLAWFSVVEVLAFTLSPGGIDLISAGPAALPVALVVTAVLAFLIGRRPELALTTCAVVLALVQIGLSEAGLNCLSGLGIVSAAGLVVTFVAVFALARVGLRLLGR